jgi:uncharacterized protein YjbI with pentapeptide repeats
LVHHGFTSAVIVSVMVEEKDKRAARGKEGRQPWTLKEFGGKTVWDWMDLLIVPLALALITVALTIVFTWQQESRQSRIEEQRAQAERELEEQRAQDEALRAYFDQMSSLLLEKDLRASEEESEARTLARARTLTVLGSLDPSRKTTVMQFLVEAELVQRVEGTSGHIITLSDADLRGVNLEAADLLGAGLSDANLSDAYLGLADLREADLGRADLSNAYLGFADLSNANLGAADLRDASMGGADLSEADLGFADLRRANLSEADLVVADLSNANLSKADLSDADLRDANLLGADLSGANLREANLSRARDITEEQLEVQAKTLEGATMPDGQKYEDWLRDK